MGQLSLNFTYSSDTSDKIFDHPEGGRNVEDQLLALCQGRNTAAEYALSFRTLAAQTDWTQLRASIRASVPGGGENPRPIH